MRLNPYLKQLLSQQGPGGELRALDVWFVQRMIWSEDESESGVGPVSLAGLLVSQRMGQGDVCVDLRDWVGTPLFRGAEFADSGLMAPDLQTWLQALQGSDRVFVAQGASADQVPGDQRSRPLVLDGTRLYLHRYWHYETRLSTDLLIRAEVAGGYDKDAVMRGLTSLFSEQKDHEPDWQRVAAGLATRSGLTVISGGPGTGKTHTVASLLMLLAELSGDQGAGPLRMAMAAPTGKAAARLTESLIKAMEGLQERLSETNLLQHLPQQASTLHHLLGVRPGRVRPRHDRDNPLHLDLLVVDEASMVDLPMMSRLVEALPASCRLILLGDKDQLASVEAGSVFADLCARGAQPDYSAELRDFLGLSESSGSGAETVAGAMADSLALLTHSYRFDSASGIGGLARAVNAGDGEASRRVLLSDGEDVRWQAPPEDRFERQLVQVAKQAFVPVLSSQDPAAALVALNQFRVLCAVRKGMTGVEQVNALIEKTLFGLSADTGGFQQGKPIMITRNDAGLGLYNGDIGICWKDAEDAPLRVWFPDETAESGVRGVLPSRLPEHEAAYAMTVHKSQGSEFAEVLMILPYRDNPVLTRELVYTGLTRARKAVEIWAGEPVLMEAIQRRVKRSSGLFERLYYPES